MISGTEPEGSLSPQKNMECTFNPRYGFKRLHVMKVTADVLRLLLKGRITFQVSTLWTHCIARLPPGFF